MLMAIMLLQSSGLFLWHTLQVSYVRHEMKQRIKAGVADEDLVILKISQKEEQNPEVFEREHSREFRYKGEMYDVIRLEVNGDTTVYSCIHDVMESRIFDRLDKLVLQELNEDDDHRKYREIMLVLFQQVYLPISKEEINHPSDSCKPLFAYCDLHSQIHTSDPGEPPRFMFFT